MRTTFWQREGDWDGQERARRANLDTGLKIRTLRTVELGEPPDSQDPHGRKRATIVNHFWRRLADLPFPALLMVPAILLQACDRGGDPWQGSVTDSAGVTLVRNPATPVWASGEAWTVTEELRIGTVAGQPEYQFGQITFLDVAHDGTIYVMDMQAREVRAYDPEGTYLRTIGGPGSGPGELSQQAPFVFVDREGGLVVPDMGNQRVSRYGPGGEPAGSFPIQMQSGVPTRWMLDRSGRLMAQLRGLDIPGMAALSEGDPIVVYDTTGAVTDTVAILPKGQMLEGMTEERLSITLFAPEPVWDLAPDGSAVYAMNDRYRILVNDPGGSLRRIITREVPRKSVEEADRNAILRLMREQYEQFGVPPAQAEQIMAGIGFAPYYPAFAQLLVGPGETLWVQRIRSARDMADAAGELAEFDPQDLASPEWEILDAEGRYLGVVALPDRFNPVAVRGDDLYGVWRDELDVQYVMRVRVHRAGG